jgi:hypothetical protein
MPTSRSAITVGDFSAFPPFLGLTVPCAGIRALPNIGNQTYQGFTNVAILRYLGALPINPTADPNVNIPTSVLPLSETDLHVGSSYSSPIYVANHLRVQPLEPIPVVSLDRLNFTISYKTVLSSPVNLVLETPILISTWT